VCVSGIDIREAPPPAAELIEEFKAEAAVRRADSATSLVLESIVRAEYQRDMVHV